MSLASESLEFSWFVGNGIRRLPAWPLELAVLAGAAVLLTYLILFVLRPQARGEGVDRWRTMLLLARD
jgi:hypothetical protein